MASECELEGLGLAPETITKLKDNGFELPSDLALLVKDREAMEEMKFSSCERLRLKDAVRKAFSDGTADSGEEFDWRDTVRDKIYSMFKHKVEDILTPVTLYLNHDETLADWKTLRTFLEDDRAFGDYVEKLAKDLKNGYRSQKKLDDKYSIGVGAVIAYGFTGMARVWGKLPSEVQGQFLLLANQNWVLQKLSDGVNRIGGDKVFGLWNVIYGGYQTAKNVWKFKNGEIDGITCANNIVKVWLTTLGGWAGGIAGAAVGLAAGPVGALVGGAAGAMAGAVLGGMLADWLTENLFSGSFAHAAEKAREVLGGIKEVTMAAVREAYKVTVEKIHDQWIIPAKKAYKQLEADTARAVLEAGLGTFGCVARQFDIRPETSCRFLKYS